MFGIITLPFRLLRTVRFVLIGLGAVITGCGLWLQINGIPMALAPVLTALRTALALAVDPQATVFGLMSSIGGVLGLTGLLGMTLHDIAPRRPPAAPDVSDLDAGAPAPGPAARRQAAQSTWQERLAAKSAAHPAPGPVARPAFSFAAMLRRIVILLVIGAFLAVLAATLNGYANPAASALADAGPGQAMIRAHLAAAGGSAAPAALALSAFNLPDLTATDLVPWGKETLARALTGDQDAMILLGSMVGGLLALLVAIKMMVAVRRRRVSGRRVSMGQMGYN